MWSIDPKRAGGAILVRTKYLVRVMVAAIGEFLHRRWQCVQIGIISTFLHCLFFGLHQYPGIVGKQFCRMSLIFNFLNNMLRGLCEIDYRFLCRAIRWLLKKSVNYISFI